MTNNRIILYLGLKGFPFGSAEVQRQLQISKALTNENQHVLVVNARGVHSRSTVEREKIKAKGAYEGVDYLYTSCTPIYPANFIIRNIFKTIGLVVEFFTILYYTFTKKTHTVIVCTSSLSKLRYYRRLTQLTNTKVIYDYVEYFAGVKDRTLKDTSDKNGFDALFYKYIDGLIVISSYLEKHVAQFRADLPHVVIPPIIDFDKFSKISYKPDEPSYFLYCGSTQYLDVIQFIIAAYRASNTAKKGTALVLIVNGAKDIISNIKAGITQEEKIRILSSLPYETLIGYYKYAKALLIPLQDNLQDKARFPFKISEYTAAARPIITSDCGAIMEYFQNEHNALIAKTGDVNDFSSKLEFALNNTEKMEMIANRSHDLGLRSFNYKRYVTPLAELISSIEKPR